MYWEHRELHCARLRELYCIRRFSCPREHPNTKEFSCKKRKFVKLTSTKLIAGDDCFCVVEAVQFSIADL